jgi:serine/threonine protein kinase/formylglycine-generating enzyme required for sulfatase activity
MLRESEIRIPPQLTVGRRSSGCFKYGTFSNHVLLRSIASSSAIGDIRSHGFELRDRLNHDTFFRWRLHPGVRTMPVRLQCPNPECNGSFSALESDAPRFRRCPQCGWELSGFGTSEPVAPGAGDSPLLVSSSAASLSGLGQGTTFARRYTIIKPLGRGGMGAVYLANDRELEREVALKIPFLLDEDPEFRQRFRREARAAARLSHANICAIFDVGEHEGQPYITMAYVEGVLLSAYIKDRPGPLDPQEAVRLVRKLAQTLEFAHQKGVVHRDLKPANIMLNDVAGPILMDFGLARREDRQESLRTRAGQQLGTPAYMPIEQFQGKIEAIGHRSDIYSLGVILFELLTGRRPYEGNAFEIHLKVIRSATPPSPSSVRPGLDPALDFVCQKAMAREIEDRYGSMRAFDLALKGITNPTISTASKFSPVGDDRPTLPETKPPAPLRVPEAAQDASARETQSNRTPAELTSFWTMKLQVSLAAIGVVLLIVVFGLFQLLKRPGGAQLVEGSPNPGTVPSSEKAAGQLGDGRAAVAGGPGTGGATGKARDAAGAGDNKATVATPKVPNNATVVAPARSAGLAAVPEGILLRYDPELRKWKRLTESTALAPGSRLLCLTGSRVAIAFGHSRLVMLAESEIHILPQSTDAAPVVELLQGRLLVHSGTPASLDVGPSDRLIKVSLPQNGGAALERPSQWVYGRPKYPAPPLVIYSTAGVITVSRGKKEETLSSPGALSADPTGLKRLTSEALPTWAKETGPSPEDIKARERFAKILHPGRAILTDIVAALEDQNTDNKQLSILALKSMGEISHLIPLLSRKDDRAVRRVTLAAIRAYIALGPAAWGEVREQIVAEFGADEASFVGTMLVGFSSQAARPQLLTWLVSLLSRKEESVGVRELALDTLNELTGRDDLGYDADHPRGNGLSAWIDLERRGALRLKPAEISSAFTEMVLIRIEPDQFQMGSKKADDEAEEKETPQHSVRITRPYYLGKYEVTQADYEVVVGVNPSHFKGDLKCPVENLSWLDAVRYCNQLSERDGFARFYEISDDKVRVVSWTATGYRLPTEAEWEYACRARTEFALSDDQENLDGDAWFSANSDKRTHNVGQKRRNPFGFYDMRGNVSEWCWDIFDFYSTNDDVLEDPRGGGPPRRERVIRGGGWINEPVRCRPANRYAVNPAERAFDLGFRVARDGAMPGQAVRETVPK